MKRLALVLVVVLAVGSLAACGSGNKKSTTSSGPKPPVQNGAQIKSAFERFFSSKTPAATRVSLLQNGSEFKAIISALAKNPLASNTSATVSKVTVQGSNAAKVVYSVNLSGQPIPGLKNRTGTAVREHGMWKVGIASFCALVELQSTPPQCRKP